MPMGTRNGKKPLRRPVNKAAQAGAEDRSKAMNETEYDRLIQQNLRLCRRVDVLWGACRFLLLSLYALGIAYCFLRMDLAHERKAVRRLHHSLTSVTEIYNQQGESAQRKVRGQE